MSKIAIVFIHGLRGNSDTWVNDSKESFRQILCRHNQEIDVNCDFYEYNYFSKITEFMNGFIAKQSLNFLNRFNPFKSSTSSTKQVRKNKTISHLASGLEAELRARYADHEEIILIGHSLGGLVAKNLILSQFKTNNLSNIKAYISIATPHHGSLGALFLAFSNNKHIGELKPLDEQTMHLEKEWGKNKAKLPSSLYLVSLDDEVVLPHCATPNDALDKDIYKLNDEDHTSICKPKDENSLSFTLVEKFIQDRLSRMLIKNEYEKNKTKKLKGYEGEIFTIKLIIADVNRSLIKSSKESYFKAEISSRVNKKSVDELNDLYDKIKFIYQQEFYLFDTGKLNSSELVYKVHSIIKANDSTALESAIESLSFIEKTGMLHQLANSIDEEVVWCHKAIPEALND
jgi:predicted alpha/beta hydrolase family esterase